MKTKEEAKFEAIDKSQLVEYSKELFTKYAELRNLIASAPIHLACDVKIKREFGKLAESSNFYIQFSLIGDSDVFEYMREE